MKNDLGIVGIAVCSLLLAGCETFYQAGYDDDERREAMRIEMARQQAARDLEAMKAETEALSEMVQRLDARIDRIEGEARQAGATRAELDGLRRDLDQLRAERAELRKQIVDDLSSEMAKLLAAQAPASGRDAGGGATSGTETRGQSGWEHKVQAGQTLSEIAAAYKVPVAKIIKANNLKDDRIRVGQVLFIPD
ncbi:MAG: LysM peptidoglycan-binding domain-containing protein [Kiritimatiellae bacterium]|nr:LysM peptidoglycan-binding domain-containing protein [Kiritimatiellia bacterium]